MRDVVLLSLAENAPAGEACGTTCGSAGGTVCGTGEGSSGDGTGDGSSADRTGSSADRDRAGCCGGDAVEPPARPPRVPVLACADALTRAGARVEMVTASSDAQIDAVIARFDARPRTDGLVFPDAESKLGLVVAAATDGQLRAVVRRIVRRYAPPPSRRPADLPADRTVPDLPPLAILPLAPAGAAGPQDLAAQDLAAQLGLPRDPAAVAEAVLTGPVRRLDLLRNDGGSVTLDGALLGGLDDSGRAVPWRGRVEVDDTVLSDGSDPIVACAIGNGAGYARFAGVSLLSEGNPSDGRVEVAVALPVLVKRPFRAARVRIEVRRARGRAASILPRDGEVQFLDDGVAGGTARKRSWWMEAGAWAVYG